jgi:nitrogen fixation protein NifB
LDIQQMRHCQQCRADAIGLLHEDRSHEFRMCNHPEGSPVSKAAPQTLYTIAVTSKYGKLVDQHFGHAAEFIIYQGDGQNFSVLEQRPVNKFCDGIEECGEERGEQNRTISALRDCQAVLTMRIGQHAKDKLAEQGIKSIEFCDSVENGLRHTVTILREEAALAVKGVKAG